MQPPDPRGEVPEWSNGAVSKTVVGASPPRVRIPVSPPLSLGFIEKSCKSLNLLTFYYTFSAGVFAGWTALAGTKLAI